jgi:hypothetical protein
MDKVRDRTNVELIISLLVVTITIFGSTMFLYLHSSTQIDSLRESTDKHLTAIQEEMKDFHGRLCAIEERYRK